MVLEDSVKSHPLLEESADIPKTGNFQPIMKKEPTILFKIGNFQVKRGVMVHVVLVLVQVAFAGWHVSGKRAIDAYHIPASVFAFMREIFSILLMGLSAFGVDGFRLPQTRHLWVVICLGFVGVFVNQLCFLKGLVWTTATNAAISQLLIPIFSTLLAIVFRFEGFRYLKVIGIFISAGGALLGSLMVAKYHNEELEAAANQPCGTGCPSGLFCEASTDTCQIKDAANFMLGNVMLLLQVLSLAIQVLIQKVLLRFYPPATLTFWGYCVGTLVMITYSLIDEMGLNTEAIASFANWDAALALCYSCVFATWFTYNMLCWANKHAPVSVVTMYMCLQPIVTATLSYFVLHETLYWVQLGGGVMIAVGLGLTSYSKWQDSKLAKAQMHAQLQAEITAGCDDPMKQAKIPLLGADCNPETSYDEAAVPMLAGDAEYPVSPLHDHYTHHHVVPAAAEGLLHRRN